MNELFNKFDQDGENLVGVSVLAIQRNCKIIMIVSPP